MGNYYLDMWRVCAYTFVPASLIMGVLLLADGIPMTLDGSAKVATVEPASMGNDDKGQAQPQEISRGPVAAIIPIKHLGTNGGGFFGANSAHPYENPSAWSNFLTVMNFCLYPFALVLMFGRMLRQMRHAWVIFGVMMTMFVVPDRLGHLLGHAPAESRLDAHPAIAGQPAVPACRSIKAWGTWKARNCVSALPPGRRSPPEPPRFPAVPSTAHTTA